MKRTIATLGIVGLGLMTATVSANATTPVENEKKITICHATSADTNLFVSETIALSALVAHTNDTFDIVPANDGTIMPEGQNLTEANLAILANNCAAVVVPPVVVTPPPAVVTPPPAVVTPPPAVVTPPPVVETPDPEVKTPDDEIDEDTEETEENAPGAGVTLETVVPSSAAAVVAPKAAAAAAKKTNVGYNVQTSVEQTSPTGIPVWLMALTGVLTAGAATVVWQGGRRAARNTNS
jgi:hypothetical protein